MNVLILFSHRWRAGRAGGAETHVIDLMNGLAEKGHQIVLVTDRVDDSTHCGTHAIAAHYELPFKTSNPLAYIRTYRQLLDIVVQHRIDIIHAHHRTAGYFAEYLHRSTHIPYVVTVHDLWHRAPFKKLHGRFFRNLIAVSEFIRQAFVREFGIPPHKIKTIYNGVNAARFEAIDLEQAALYRKKYGVRPQDIVISLVGRISRFKGHYDLLHALTLLPNELPYKCLIVGEGKERKKLEQAVISSGLAEKVQFCGYQPDIPLVMAASDIVLLPSYRETFGLTIVEAMLSHRAVIASNAGGIPEIITHNKDGLLFQVGDVPALAKSIETLVSDQALRVRLAEAGYKNAVERFPLERMIDETERHYLELLRRN